MAAPGRSGDDRPSRLGYMIAVAVSAVAHVAVIIFVLFVVPKLFGLEAVPPLSESVKIVDSLPAGDIGTRLPPINSEQPPPRPRRAERKEPPPPPEQAHPTPPPPDDKNAIALNSLTPTIKPTPAPTPTPVETPEPTPEPTRTPRPHRTPRPTPKATPRPKASPKPKQPKPKATPTPVAEARAEATPDMKTAMDKVRQELLKSHLDAIKNKNVKPAEGTNSERVIADREREGAGMGVGPGKGSVGMLQDPVFVMYYQDVQDRITKAFSFSGGDPNLTATVSFGINPDGSLNSLKVIDSSHDPAFDDSVRRAIRAAAPFGPPPEKYREAFAGGVSANFKLSELQGDGG